MPSLSSIFVEQLKDMLKTTGWIVCGIDHSTRYMNTYITNFNRWTSI